MSQIQKGETFNDGEVVTGARLNDLIDSATILHEVISDQTLQDPAIGTDQVLLLRGTTLKKANIAGLPTGISSIGLNTTDSFAVVSSGGNPLTANGTFTFGFNNQSGNKICVSPAGGFNGQPTFRRVVPKDLVIPPVEIAANNIDFSLGFVFYQVLTTPRNFFLTNGTPGQRILVTLAQGNSNNNIVSWTVTGGSIRWPGGTAHTMTIGNARYDEIEIYCASPTFYTATFNKDFT